MHLGALQRLVTGGQWKKNKDLLIYIARKYVWFAQNGYALPANFFKGTDFVPFFSKYANTGQFSPESSDDEDSDFDGQDDDDYDDDDSEEPPLLTQEDGVENDENGNDEQPPILIQEGGQAGHLDEIVDPFNITEGARTNIPKYGVTGKQYSLTFNDRGKIRDVDALVRAGFAEVLHHAKEGMSSRDKMGIEYSHSGLNSSFYIPFSKSESINEDRIITVLNMLIQSAEDLAMDGEFKFTITTIKPKRGGKPRKKRWNFEKWLNKLNCLIRIRNKDSLCLPRAIITAMNYNDKITNGYKKKLKLDAKEEERQWNNIRRSCGLQKKYALQLLDAVGLSWRDAPFGHDQLKIFQDFLAPKYNIKVFGSNAQEAIIFDGGIKDAEKTLFLYFVDPSKMKDKNNDVGHYHVVTKPHALLNNSYFCNICNKGHDNRKKHRCSEKCQSCFQLGHCAYTSTQDVIHCPDCNRMFKNQKCFNNHLLGSQNAEIEKDEPPTKKQRLFMPRQSVCESFHRCKHCPARFNPKKGHRCGYYWCYNCQEDHEKDKFQCFIPPLRELSETQKKNNLLQKKIFFDFECSQEQEHGKSDTGLTIFLHKPVLCVAYRTCIHCQDAAREGDFQDCGQCGPKKFVFPGGNCAADFCEWLFSEENRNTCAFSHNGGNYDNLFLARYLFDQNVSPTNMLMKGRTIMCMEYDGIKVLDSHKFLPMPLADFTKTFDLTTKKGYFPFKFITKANEDYKGPTPDVKFYAPESMKAPARRNFLEWYKDQQGRHFDFKEQILEYCDADVQLLMRGILNFEKKMKETTGMPIFDHCITIAGAAMSHFRKNCMKKKTIAIIPPGGYNRRQNQSLEAIKWMKWLAHKQGIHIQHAWNGAEVKIGKHHVDGVDVKNRTVYEYHGCIVSFQNFFRSKAQVLTQLQNF